MRGKKARMIRKRMGVDVTAQSTYVLHKEKPQPVYNSDTKTVVARETFSLRSANKAMYRKVKKIMTRNPRGE